MDEITLIIAIWGAILSTILAVIQLYQNRRAIMVKLKLTPIIQGNFEDFEYKLVLDCTNKSKRAIQIKKVGIKTDSEQEFFAKSPSIDVELPKTLKDREGIRIHFELANLLPAFEYMKKKETKKIRGFVDDASDKRYFSKLIDFDVQYFLDHYSKLTNIKA